MSKYKILNLKLLDDEEDNQNSQTNQRINRGKTQKIYLVNRNVNDQTAIFNIMGTTGNIYEVKLSGSPTCTCPDFSQRHSRCKHIFFMLAKIFNVKDPNQKNFTSEEISQYINNYKANIAKFNIKYDIIAGSIDVGIKGLDDDCCICLDTVLNGDKYVYCKTTCGRCIHADCYNMVVKKTLKCPYCSNTFKCSEILG